MVLILVVIAWLYVTTMMAVAKPARSTAACLGLSSPSCFMDCCPCPSSSTFFSTPVRKRMRKAREEQAMRQWELEQQEKAAVNAANSAVEPDGNGKPPAST